MFGNVLSVELAERDAELVGDALGQVDARAAGEQHHAPERGAVARAAARSVLAAVVAARGEELAGAEQAVGRHCCSSFRRASTRAA